MWSTLPGRRGANSLKYSVLGVLFVFQNVSYHSGAHLPGAQGCSEEGTGEQEMRIQESICRKVEEAASRLGLVCNPRL